MKNLHTISFGLLAALFTSLLLAQQSPRQFKWLEGKRAALSLSFDDARASQVTGGTALLDRYNVKATFYVVPSALERQLEGWKKAVAAGHEIGNHSLNHPCTGNFEWSRKKALEDYSLEKMRDELLESNRRIKELLGVTAESFAYPCGQTFVGRGFDTRSYVPVAASLFGSARTWLDEAPNDPSFCDLWQLTGMEMDGKDFAQIQPLLAEARKNGRWLVLAGHEMGKEGTQTTRLAMLDELIRYVQRPDSEIWLAPVGTIARYVREQRKQNQ